MIAAVMARIDTADPWAVVFWIGVVWTLVAGYGLVLCRAAAIRDRAARRSWAAYVRRSQGMSTKISRRGS